MQERTSLFCGVIALVPRIFADLSLRLEFLGFYPQIFCMVSNSLKF